MWRISSHKKEQKLLKSVKIFVEYNRNWTATFLIVQRVCWCLENTWNDSYPSAGNSSLSSQSRRSGTDNVAGIVVGSIVAAVVVFLVVSCFYIFVNYVIDEHLPCLEVVCCVTETACDFRRPESEVHAPLHVTSLTTWSVVKVWLPSHVRWSSIARFKSVMNVSRPTLHATIASSLDLVLLQYSLYMAREALFWLLGHIISIRPMQHAGQQWQFGVVDVQSDTDSLHMLIHRCLQGTAPNYLIDRCTPVSDVVGRQRLPVVCSSSYHDTGSPHSAVGPSLLWVRRSGTCCQTTSELNRTVTVFAGTWRLFCSLITSVFSALEMSYDNALYKSILLHYITLHWL